MNESKKKNKQLNGFIAKKIYMYTCRHASHYNIEATKNKLNKTHYLALN